MDAAARHLRDGKGGGSTAPMCIIIQDSKSLGGGSAMLWQIASSLASGVAEGSGAIVACSFLDDATTASRWLLPQHRHLLTVTPYEHVDPPRTLHSYIESGLTCRDPNASTQDASSYVVIDSLSTAFMYQPALAILASLRSLRERSNVAGVLALLDIRMHARHEVEILRAQATCEMLLKPANQLQAEVMMSSIGRTVHIEAITSTLRRSGRIKVDSGLYEMLPDGSLRHHVSPRDAPITAQQLASSNVSELQKRMATAEAVERDKLQSKYEKDMSGFMKLSLSKKEQEARDKVVLPYQHAGGVGKYDAADFREYLPPAAGGEGKGSGNDGFGHIHYVRDSDNDYDSDEDPDDDLDI